MPMPGTDAGSARTAVVLAGVHGHGRSHLANLARLAASGGGRHGITLAGVADPLPLTPEQRARVGDAATSPDLGTLLERVRPAVTIVCTPIQTHVDLALEAVAHGSHVLLEKPPAPSLAELARLAGGLSGGPAGDGPACQVGFQSLGSEAVGHVRALVADGAVGEVTGIGATCVWTRDESYYARARWAGRRRLDGVEVVDGVLTNPFAHAVATALRLDGSDGPGAVASIELELFRANDIEADDTSCVRIRTSRGTTIVVAATLCGERSGDPVITVHGSAGRIVYAYKRDEVRLCRGGPRGGADGAGRAEQVWRLRSHDLLENLVDHVHDPGVPLLVPLPRTTAFMQVVEAVRTAPDPRRIDGGAVAEEPAGAWRRRYVPGVDAAVAACAERLALFSELGLPWARR
jgi:predicted dehydrogenase